MTPAIRNAAELVTALDSQLQGIQVPSDLRTRVVAACLGIVIDHHHGIVILLQNQRTTSAFALVRLLFEGYVRGTWLLRCAPDAEVHKFSEGWEPPGLAMMLTELEPTNSEENKWLTAFRAASWKALCSYTHTGELQVQRWQTPGSVEPNFHETEIAEVLTTANLFAALSAVELVALTGIDALLEKVNQALMPHMPTGA